MAKGEQVKRCTTCVTANRVYKQGVRRSTATRTNSSAQTYKWGDITIPQVTSYKYLGVTMNNINTWDGHFEARLRSGTKAAAPHHKVLT
jgi:hypothetical protein